MSFHLYRIRQIFSNADGTVQYIELAVGAFDSENLWRGHSIKSIQGGVTHEFAFPSNLPSDATAGTTVLLATQAVANMGLVVPDFIIPDGFLFTGGGSLNFADVDTITYPALPTDGSHALDRIGNMVAITLVNFDGDTGTFTLSVGSGQTFNGTPGPDVYTGGSGNDSIDGAGGIDTVNFHGTRVEYDLSRSAGAVNVADHTAGRDGTDRVINAEILRFSDRSVDLGMAAKAASIPAATLKTLEELYVGFFNRVPEAAGLGYWIDQIKAGVSLASIANQFYDAGVIFGNYPSSMTNAQFIREIYKNVLGRPPGVPPTDPEVGYWEDRLVRNIDTKGTMVLQMLSDVHTYFEGITDPTNPNYAYQFVSAHLNNKAAVANWYAVQQGLSLNVQVDNVAFGIQMAALITPTDTSAAMGLVGLSDSFANV